MKKSLFQFVAVVSLAPSSWQAYAQRYLPKMKGMELRGGFVNGSKSPLNYYTGIAMSGYTKKANRWVVGAEYLLKNYDYRDTSVPRSQFTVKGGTTRSSCPILKRLSSSPSEALHWLATKR